MKGSAENCPDDYLGESARHVKVLKFKKYAYDRKSQGSQ